ncbi:hypothetical protein MGSAQ_002751, partial [marine sediment metagenome]
VGMHWVSFRGVIHGPETERWHERPFLAD